MPQLVVTNVAAHDLGANRSGYLDQTTTYLSDNTAMFTLALCLRPYCGQSALIRRRTVFDPIYRNRRKKAEFQRKVIPQLFTARSLYREYSATVVTEYRYKRSYLLTKSRGMELLRRWIAQRHECGHKGLAE